MATKSIPKQPAADNQQVADAWASYPDKWANEDFHCEMSTLAGEALALGSVIEPMIRDCNRAALHAIVDGDLSADGLVYLTGMLLNKLHELDRELKP